MTPCGASREAFAPITGVAGCCARAPTGKVAAVLARPAMKSRRLMGVPFMI
jgi:hypothetical protein